MCLVFFQRYKFNLFLKPERVDEENGNDYNFYIRPYIPFWSLQSLSFNAIVDLDKVPSQREGMHPRFVLEKLGRTWISIDPVDKQWFDQENIFQELKEDLVLKLQSKFISKSSGKIIYFTLKKFVYALYNFVLLLLVRSLNNISEFHRQRELILDCWMLYLHKNFKNVDHPVELKFFPMWNTSTEVEISTFV